MLLDLGTKPLQPCLKGLFQRALQAVRRPGKVGPLFVEQIEPRLLGSRGGNLGDQPETLVEAFARESGRSAGAEEASELGFEVRLVWNDGVHGRSILRMAFERQGSVGAYRVCFAKNDFMDCASSLAAC